MFRHVLVATDGSPQAEPAVRAGVGLAAALGARLTGLCVLAPYAPAGGAIAGLHGFARAVRVQARHTLAGLLHEAHEHGVKVKSCVLVGGEPWRAIIDTARARKCDLIVMGSHGRSGLSGVLLGSEAQKVLTHATVPVLVCR